MPKPSRLSRPSWQTTVSRQVSTVTAVLRQQRQYQYSSTLISTTVMAKNSAISLAAAIRSPMIWAKPITRMFTPWAPKCSRTSFSSVCAKAP
ncbi:hypothetical protein D3C81_1432290 [compost metagenome]